MISKKEWYESFQRVLKTAASAFSIGCSLASILYSLVWCAFPDAALLAMVAFVLLGYAVL